MFSTIETAKFTFDFSVQTEQLMQALNAADAIVIGAGAGLSASAGFVYAGARFEANFADFIAKYHYTDLYSAGFYPYASPEEYWAYWSRHILLNRYVPIPNSAYRDLLALVRDRDYFVITTNVDHCFQKAGFDKNRLFYTQGDYGLFQCVDGCDGKTYDNESVIRQMVAQQRKMRIPAELIPRCPLCGKPMTVNLRSDNRFVEDVGWHAAAERYSEFLQRHKTAKVLFLELGVGRNTPSIIKFSFWRMTHQWPNATYACVNRGEAHAPRELKAKSLCINADIGSVLLQLSKSKSLCQNQEHHRSG